MIDTTTIFVVLLPLMIILLILSAFFSASETAITSINVIRLKQMARGKLQINSSKAKKRSIKKAKRVYKFVKDYDRTLATILIINTLVNTALATVGSLFFTNIINSAETATWVATVVIGVLVLIFGELVPKTIVKRFPEKFSIFAAYILTFWKILVYPFTWFLVLKKHHAGVSTTENELLELISTIESEGVLEKNEKKLIESAIVFDEKNVGSVMRQKNKVKWIYSDIPWRELQTFYKEERYTRMPVLDRKTDLVIGLLNIKDVFIALIDHETLDFKKLSTEPIFLSRYLKLDDALEIMQQEQIHMAIVSSSKDSNDFLGVVTMEDILEELVGEIYDEDDETGSVKEIGHHMFWIHGNMRVPKVFQKYLQIAAPPDTHDKTLYQWFVSQTNYDIKNPNPSTNEFIYHNYAFRINNKKTRRGNVKGIMFEIESLTDLKPDDDLED
ncbi:hemolysin family protein [Spiroplasma chrysopicola]|uniref:Hymolysin-related protein n=1 Tax=Spiroplasma chrysopicola DF-1 TaxID=1276227 RepID=R4UIQ5_9MOLU|nr:hemolysin family protein [Spiroplasma chrysopicola]AGM25186.1 hymolysin-related protein [Spiroplasma chrysopicola DF-1]